MIKWYASLGLGGFVIVATAASVRSSQGGGTAMLIFPSYSPSNMVASGSKETNEKNGKMVVCKPAGDIMVDFKSMNEV